MKYNRLKEKMNTVLDASIMLSKYIKYLEEQALEVQDITEKDYYKRESNKIRKIANDLDNIYDDYATVYYYMLYDSIDNEVIENVLLQGKN